MHARWTVKSFGFAGCLIRTMIASILNFGRSDVVCYFTAMQVTQPHLGGKPQSMASTLLLECGLSKMLNRIKERDCF